MLLSPSPASASSSSSHRALSPHVFAGPRSLIMPPHGVRRISRPPSFLCSDPCRTSPSSSTSGRIRCLGTGSAHSRRLPMSLESQVSPEFIHPPPPSSSQSQGRARPLAAPPRVGPISSSAAQLRPSKPACLRSLAGRVPDRPVKAQGEDAQSSSPRCCGLDPVVSVRSLFFSCLRI